MIANSQQNTTNTSRLNTTSNARFTKRYAYLSSIPVMALPANFFS